MELLESQDPDKKKLIESSERHKRALEKQVSELSAKTEKVVTNALIIGGSLALTYFLVSSLSSHKKKKKKRTKAAQTKADESVTEAEAEDVEEKEESLIIPAIVGAIGSKVINTATMMLLDIAKEKLFGYLKSRKQDDENS